MGLGQSRAQKGLPLTIYSEYIKKKNIYIDIFIQSGSYWANLSESPPSRDPQWAREIIGTHEKKNFTILPN